MSVEGISVCGKCGMAAAPCLCVVRDMQGQGYARAVMFARTKAMRCATPDDAVAALVVGNGELARQVDALTDYIKETADGMNDMLKAVEACTKVARMLRRTASETAPPSTTEPETAARGGWDTVSSLRDIASGLERVATNMAAGDTLYISQASSVNEMAKYIGRIADAYMYAQIKMEHAKEKLHL